MKSQWHERATWTLDRSELHSSVLSLVRQAIELRKQTAGTGTSERRNILDEADALFDDAVRKARRIHGVDRWDLVDLVNEVDAATDVRR